MSSESKQEDIPWAYWMVFPRWFFLFPRIHISPFPVGSGLLGDSRPYTRLCKCERRFRSSLLALFSLASGFTSSSSIPVNLELLFQAVAVDVHIHTYPHQPDPGEGAISPNLYVLWYCFFSERPALLLLVSSFLQQQKSFPSLVHRSGCASFSGCPGNGVSLPVDLIFQLP